jgi:IclR family acetate operon transcriptional repressor
VSSSGESPGGRSAGSTRDEGGVRSIQRAVNILTALAEHPYPLGLLELSHYVSLSRASVHRILTTLVRLGWVEQNPRTSKYRLGMGPVGIGAVGMVTNPLIRESHSYLAKLAEWTGHDAVLSTLIGGKTVQLQRVQGANSELIEFEPGHPQPAYAMADGKVLLAHLDPPEAEQWLTWEGMAPFTSMTITDVGEMMVELAKIREAGYAVDNSERFEGGRGLAVPIRGDGGMPVAAMLAIGKLDPAKDEATVQQMQSLARGLSDRLRSAGELPTAVYEAFYASPKTPPVA